MANGSPTIQLGAGECFEVPGLVVDPGIEELRARFSPDHPDFVPGVTITDAGAIAETNPPEERGRDPKRTFFVRTGDPNGLGEKIEWDGNHFKEFPSEAFDAIVKDVTQSLGGRNIVYDVRGRLGADPSLSIPTRAITDSVTGAIFAGNMYREPRAAGDPASEFEQAGLPGIDVIYLPNDTDKIDPAKYGLQDLLGDKRTSIVVTNPDTGKIVSLGVGYQGSEKKCPYTQVCLMAAEVGAMPWHASAVHIPGVGVVLIVGLSGTGKSSLSAGLGRQLADDEALLRNGRVSNLEGGIYPIAKGLRLEKERALFKAITDKRGALSRVLLQNAVVAQDGRVLFDDTSLTDNTRASVPFTSEYLENIIEGGEGGPLAAIVLLNMDPRGVMPPIAKLNSVEAQQAAYALGATGKSAAQVNDKPGLAMSFGMGAPFLPRPSTYLKQFKDLQRPANRPDVWMVNTGWTGGPQFHEDKGREGERMPIQDTLDMMRAALTGKLDGAEMVEDPRFRGLMVPKIIPGSESATALMDTRANYKGPVEEFDAEADELAAELREKGAARFAKSEAMRHLVDFLPVPLR